MEFPRMLQCLEPIPGWLSWTKRSELPQKHKIYKSFHLQMKPTTWYCVNRNWITGIWMLTNFLFLSENLKPCNFKICWTYTCSSSCWFNNNPTCIAIQQYIFHAICNMPVFSVLLLFRKTFTCEVSGGKTSSNRKDLSFPITSWSWLTNWTHTSLEWSLSFSEMGRT